MILTTGPSISGGLSLLNAINFSSTATTPESSFVTFTGSNPFYFLGTAGATAVNGAAPNNAVFLNILNTGGVTLAGLLSGAGNLTVQGGGTLYLNNADGGTTTNTGILAILNGVVNVQQAGAINTMANVVVASGSALQLQGGAGFTMSRPLYLWGNGPSGNGALESVYGNNTASGLIALNGPATIGVDSGYLYTSNVISGPGDFTKAGPGTLELNAANTFTGTLYVANGILANGGSEYSFGSVVAPLVVQSGATLESIYAGGNIPQAKTLILSGDGYAGAPIPGALIVAPGGNLNLQGALMLNPGAVIGVPAGTTITVNGIISDAVTGTPADLNKAGLGALVLQAANSFSGQTNVMNGTLTLNQSGSLATTSTVNLYAGTTLTLDDNGNGNTQTYNLTDRLNDAAAVNIDGATLTFNASASYGAPLVWAEAVGAVTVTGGQATINTGWAVLPVAGSSAALTMASWTAAAGTTADFNGNTVDIGAAQPAGTSSNQIILQAQPTLIGSGANAILPNALIGLANSAIVDFATTTGSAPTINVVPFSNYSTAADINSAAPGSIYKLTTSQTLTSSLSLGAVLLSGNNLSFDGVGGSTLTLTDGQLATAGTNIAVTVPTIALGSAAGSLMTNGNSTPTISSVIAGTGSLAIGGLGTLTLAGQSTFSGGVTLAGGTLALATSTVGRPDSVTSGPVGTGTLTLVAGTLQAPGAVTIANALNLAGATVTIAGNANLTFSGNGTLTNDAGSNALPSLTPAQAAELLGSTLTISNTGLTTFSGVLSDGGSGSLTLAGTGTSVFSGQSTYSGGTWLLGGGLIVAASGSATSGPLGTGGLTLGGGTLMTDDNAETLANPVTIAGSAAIAPTTMNGSSTSGASLTLSGPITMAATPVSTVGVLTVNMPVTMGGSLSGAGQLSLAGPGGVTLSGNNSGYTRRHRGQRPHALRPDHAGLRQRQLPGQRPADLE